MKKNLVLLGMMGVGKTTFGKIVAKKLELRFFDTDNLIEKKNSMSVKKILIQKTYLTVTSFSLGISCFISLFGEGISICPIK